MTRLSIVLPTYNRRKTLEHSLNESLALTRHLDIEFIVIDDGSSDTTARYLDEVSQQDNRVRFKTIENGGPGNARNIGAAVARGQIILFMGDDTFPTSADFFDTHLRIHDSNPEPSVAVLGKMIWPRDENYPVSFVMSMIQGDGGQQFGYAHMRPFARYDWRFFYTCNVSIKSSVIDDWTTDGFSPDFRCAAFEDGEFAYRLQKKFGRFDIIYAPTSVAEHDHPYTVESFIGRQYAAGMMANVLAAKHPETAGVIGVAPLEQAMARSSSPTDDLNHADQLAVIEGIFAAARVLERQGQLGTEAWHTPFINAVFELAYGRGIVWSHPDADANRSAGYRAILEQFDRRTARIVEHEHLPSTLPLGTLTRKTTTTSSPIQAAVTATGSRLRQRLAANSHARNVYRWIKGTG